MLWCFGFPQSWASVPAGISEYYVPVDEDNDWTILNALGGIAAGQNMHSVISLTPWADNTVIYYDHWEDGYDFDINNPTTADETCTANVGNIKTFESSVPRPRTTGTPAIFGRGAYVGAAGNCTGQASPSSCSIGAGGNTDYCYDGRDRIVVVGGGSTMVRGGWPQTTGVVTGLAEEVYPVTPQLTTYILPFGEDLYAADNIRTDYRRVFVTIQATENTTFQVDFDHDGTFDALDCNYDGATDGTQCTLNAGEIYRLDQTSDGTGGPFATLNSGAIIKGSATLQVQYINGDSNATYNSRATSAFPRGFWDDEYYALAPSSAGGNGNTDILLHNPNNAAITIDWETRTASGSFTLNAYESAFFEAKTGSYVPATSGVYLKGSQVFWGVSDVNANSATRDWAYSLVPAYLLDNEQFLSWSPGCYDNTTGLNCTGTVANRNDGGVFIVPAQDNTTVFVDRDNDGTADYTYLLNRLQVQYVYDATDGDMTGAHIWATGPYVLSYGENLDTSQVANPSLDAGYTTLPNPGNWMDLALTVEKAANPVVLSTTANPATTTYTLTVKSHEFAVDNVSVVDTLAADWDYAVGTDTATVTYPNGSTVPLDPAKSGGTCGSDGGSCTLTWPGLGNMAPNQTLTIVFTARTVGTPNYASSALSQNKVAASATRTVGGVTQTFKASDFAYNTYLDSTVNMLVTKSSSVAEVTPVSPGDTLTYTVNVANPASSTANLTGAALYDSLPPGVSYVAGSGSISCDLGTTANFRDNFGSVAYNNSDGSSNWTSNPWSETDSLGGGAASGLVQTTGSQLRLGPLAGTNVRDEFASAAYNLNGPNNTANWNGDWTETDSRGTGATNGFVWVTNNALQFHYEFAHVSDNFDTNSSYAGNNGSVNWNAAWTESNDDASATSGSITVNTNRADFSNGTANRSIDRTATVTGATVATVSFMPTDAGFDGGETLVAEYSLDGGAYVTLGTYDGGTAGWSGVSQSFTIPLTGNNTLNLRFRVPGTWSNINDHAYIDNVKVSYYNAAISNVADNFDTNSSYAGTNGSVDWSSTPWTESNDNASAASGSITVNNNQADFINGAVNRSIDRTVTVTGATVATVSFMPTDAGFDGGETLVAEYSLDGGAYVTLGAYDGGTAGWSGVSQSFNITLSGNTTLNLRFRALEAWSSANDHAYIDNVNISYVSYTISDSASGSGIKRAANLSGASNATLTFDYTAANLEVGDTLLVEASSDGSSFTTLETLDGASGSGAKTYDLKSPIDYTSANTTIRFRVTSGFNATNETFSIDNVDITYGGGGTAEVKRTVNLTGAVNPSLTFNAAAANLEAGDTLVVEAASSASGPFTVLATYAAGTPDVAQPYILTPYISANTTIQFRITGGYTVNNETFSIDNVDISYTGISTFASASPPNFLASATGCRIPPGQSLTLTYNVTVDNPFPTGLDEIVNTAFATATEIPIPISDDARNIVLNPAQNSAAVGDKVWLDSDGDGVLDPGESGLANVEVTLKDQFGAPLQTATTDSQGRYQFNGVAAGSGYYVEVTGGLPSGLTQTLGSNNRSIAFNLTAGQAYNDADLGYKPADGSAVVGDRVWSDADGDGVQDAGEPGLAGIKVRLYPDADGDGLTDTDVTVDVIDGVVNINESNGVVDGNDDGILWGYAIIDGFVDIDRSGTITAADDGALNGYPVVNGYIDIDGDNATPPDTGDDATGLFRYLETTTAANGSYSFNVAANGSLHYIAYLDIAQPSLITYNLTTGNGFNFYNVASGGSYLTADFGVQQKTAGTTFGITDRIWLDNGSGGGAPGNGSQDGGETGISGITVDLLDASGNVIATTTTDGSGNFTFSGVPGGVRYSWRVTDQGNVLANYYGTTSSAQSSVYQMPATLTANEDHSTAPHFGYNLSRSIGDTVFNDSGAGGGTAGNGIQDGGETGLSGIVVKLYSDSGTLGAIDGSDAVIATLTTDASGRYLFSGLADGNYIVSIESPPGGYSYTGLADSDGGTAGQQRAANVAGGGNDLDNDFAYQASAPRTLSGKIWNDANNNGADNSEAGLANVTVELYADADGDGVIDVGETLVATASTDSNGNYAFAGLPGGGTEDYIVRIADQNGVLSNYNATYEKAEGTTSPFNGQESILNLNSDISDLNFGFHKPVPTYALLSGFRAYVLNGQPWVEWSTLREHGTVGFFVERENPLTGEWMRLNGGEMLRGLIVAPQGGDYRYADDEVAVGETHRYRLVEREVWGDERIYGPWRVRVAELSAVKSAQTASPSPIDAAEVPKEAWQALGRGYVARMHHIDKPKPAGFGPVHPNGALAVNAAPSADIPIGFRLRTGAEGLYRLDAKTLSDMAVSWGISNNDFVRRLSVGKLLLDSSSGIAPYFYDAATKSLYFTGTSYQTAETQQNVYRLRAGWGRKTPVATGKAPPAVAPKAFRDKQRFEVDRAGLLFSWIHSEENAGYWYWDYVMPPYRPSVVLTLQLPQPSGNAKGIFKVYLRGAGNQTVGDDRMVTASMNGVILPGSVTWDGNREAVLQAEFDQSSLPAAVNGLSEVKLQIDGVALNGAAYDLFFIDRVEVEYDRKMRAYQGNVWLHEMAAGVIGVDGFGSNNIMVIENPGSMRAKWRKDVSVFRTAAGDWQVSFKTQRNADYLLSEAPQAPQVEADFSSKLRIAAHDADYLIIAPRQLAQGAAALADYRKHSFSTEIAWLDDIYDEFSAGRTDSAAIEAFLDYVYKSWLHVPRYVVLLGRGTLDHRDLLGYHESLIPVPLAATPWGLSASDNRYADVDGDKLPDYRLGRIAVSNDAEALAYVDKLAAYEASIPDAWYLRTALVADNPDVGGDFRAGSDRIGLLLQGGSDSYSLDKLYHPIVNVRASLLSGWNNGYGYVNYIGHGSATQLASEKFISIADVAGMTNGEKLPVFAALSCAVGDSSMPGTLGLSDALVTHPGGGAIAAFSATGLSLDVQAIQLNEYFVAGLLGERGDIGESAVSAHRMASVVNNTDGFMHDIYQIAGDPAVRLR